LVGCKEGHARVANRFPIGQGHHSEADSDFAEMMLLAEVVNGSRETCDDAPPKQPAGAKDDDFALNQFGASSVLAPREPLELCGS
jgi:hypothetical protein